MVRPTRARGVPAGFPFKMFALKNELHVSSHNKDVLFLIRYENLQVRNKTNKNYHSCEPSIALKRNKVFKRRGTENESPCSVSRATGEIFDRGRGDEEEGGETRNRLRERSRSPCCQMHVVPSWGSWSVRVGRIVAY